MARRYWGIEIVSTGDGTWSSLATLELRATLGGADMAAGLPAGASSYYQGNATYAPAKAVDGDAATYWHSNGGFTQKLWVDFGVGSAVDLIAQVALRSRADGWPEQAPRVFNVISSDDAATWTTHWSGTTNGAGYAVGELKTFDHPSAAYGANAYATKQTQVVYGGRVAGASAANKATVIAFVNRPAGVAQASKGVVVVYGFPRPKRGPFSSLVM